MRWRPIRVVVHFPLLGSWPAGVIVWCWTVAQYANVRWQWNFYPTLIALIVGGILFNWKVSNDLAPIRPPNYGENGNAGTENFLPNTANK